MIQLKRILYPTDFSEASRSAERYACSLAQNYGAELHVLHAFQDPFETAYLVGAPYPVVQGYVRDMIEHAEKGIQSFPAEGVENVQVVREVRHGVPYREILDYAHTNGIDLIVMGTHGRSGLAHVLIGSVAERVVRQAQCPVLTVRPHDFSSEPRD